MSYDFNQYDDGFWDHEKFLKDCKVTQATQGNKWLLPPRDFIFINMLIKATNQNDPASFFVEELKHSANKSLRKDFKGTLMRLHVANFIDLSKDFDDEAWQYFDHICLCRDTNINRSISFLLPKIRMTSLGQRRFKSITALFC
jgi:hypothetical protein